MPDADSLNINIIKYHSGIEGNTGENGNLASCVKSVNIGGHQTVAGVQLAGKRARDVEAQLIELTKKQLEECKTNESNSFARC